MRKRIITFLLAGAVLFSGIPVDTALASPVQSVVSAGEGTENTDQTEEMIYPSGGCLRPEGTKVSSEEIADAFPEEKEHGLSSYSESYGSQQYHSTWDIYSSNYVYNQLSEKERQFWDALDTLCRKYLNSSQDAVLMRYSSGSSYVLGDILIGTMGMSVDQARNLFFIFSYSNPQYYFLDNSYVYGNKYLSGKVTTVFCPGIYEAFAKGSARKSATAKFKAKIDSMMAKVRKGSSELEKAKIAHDLIVEKIMYDPGFQSIPMFSQPYTPYHQSAYSVFCDDYTVCAGYTKAYEILMNGVGIDALGITSSSHAWNLICLNDSWYCVDLTWDDMDGRNNMSTQYTFFGISESRLTGELDQQRSHEKEAMYTGLTPKCTKDLGSTKTEVGTVYVPSQAAPSPLISQKKRSNGIAVTLSSNAPGAEIYYTLDGKNPSSSFTRSYRYTGKFLVSSNVTVKAVTVSDGMWDSSIASEEVKGRMCSVKFDTKGGKSISSRKVWPGETVKQPSNPKRAKYVFAGWYQDSKYKKKWNFNNKITKSTTIYAKWNKVKVAGTSIRKLKNTSGGKLSVTIKKNSKAKGYQIRYSTRQDLKSSKKKETKSVSKVLSGLKKGNVYYVQARAYQLDSAGKKVYGDWSKTKKVSIRK